MKSYEISYKRISVPSLDAFKEKPYATFNNFMKQVCNALGPTLMVLMLDEFEALEQRVVDGKVDADIYAQLRHQMQFSPNVAFILAGTHRLEELSADYKGIIFTGALHREVGFMDESNARALVEKPVAGQVSYEDAAVDLLWHVTCGHPYLLQLLCQHLIAEMNCRRESNFITLGDVKAAIEHFGRQRGGFFNYV